MHVSLASIAVSYYIAFSKPIAPNYPYKDAARDLENGKHMTLVKACMAPAVIDAYPDYEKAVALIPLNILKRYRP